MTRLAPLSLRTCCESMTQTTNFQTRPIFTMVRTMNEMHKTDLGHRHPFGGLTSYPALQYLVWKHGERSSGRTSPELPIGRARFYSY